MAKIVTEKNLLVRPGKGGFAFELDGAGHGALLVVDNEGTRHVVLLEPEEAIALGVALIRGAETTMQIRQSQKVVSDFVGKPLANGGH